MSTVNTSESNGYVDLIDVQLPEKNLPAREKYEGEYVSAEHLMPPTKYRGVYEEFFRNLPTQETSGSENSLLLESF